MEDGSDQLLHVLQQYLSNVNARSILSRAMRTAGVRGRALPRESMPDVVTRVERAAALFVAPDDLRRMGRELRALWQDNDVAAELIDIAAEHHIVDARTRAREMCAMMGARRLVSQKVATVVSELARNIALYTPGGTIELIPDRDPTRILIRATDQGPGISNLDEVFSGDYRSATGMGRGLLGTKAVSDRFDLDTGVAGTTVEAEIRI